ncbi:hypothetical protein [Lonepinella sp. MS14437]|uniref:hypothetical protein n=1 Tax=unclassified Lonepinella TaxID=2642006 RepID=UPI0036DF4327
MRIHKVNIIFYILLLLFVFVIGVFYDFSFDYVGISFLLSNFVILTLLLFTMKSRVNTIGFVFLFYFIFFGIAGWLQYSENIHIWVSFIFDKDDYLWTNILLIISYIVLFLSYKFTKDSNQKYINLKYEKDTSLYLLYGISFVLCLICSFIVFYDKDWNIMNLIFRGFSDDDVTTLEKGNPLWNVIVNLARFLPMFLLLLFIDSKGIGKFLILILVLFCAFPLGIPRFFVAYIYIPILVLLIPYFQRSLAMLGTLIVSLFIVFPFLNQFRYFDSNNGISLLSDLDFLKEGHFDAYQNLMSAIKLEFITYGYQLLAPFTFFVPRTMWADKPFGSGYAMAEKYGFSFNNISMPYFAEGYVNFGAVGMIAFSIALGYMMKKIDTSLLKSTNSLDYGFGIFCCAWFFFMQRGDLLSSTSVAMAGVVSYLIAKRMGNLR